MKIFHQFYDTLVQVLPAEDATFVAKLYSVGLLPGDMKAKMQSYSTQAEKVTYFLDHNIKPKVSTGNNNSLHKLLDVMEDSEDSDLKQLAGDIRMELPERNLGEQYYTGPLRTVI